MDCPQIKNNAPFIDASDRIKQIPVFIENRPTVSDIGYIRDFIHKTGIQALVSSAVGANRRPEYYGSPLYQSKLLDFKMHPDADPNYLPRFVQMAQQERVLLLSWLPLTHIWAAGHAHPEWRVKFFPDNNKIIQDDTCCLLSTGYLDFIISISQEIVTEVGFDGIWFDGVGLVGMYGAEPGAWGCACDGCRSNFEGDSGFNYPTRWDWEDPAFRAFVIWGNDKKNQVLKQITNKIREVRPDAAVVFNYSAAGPEPNGGKFNDWRVNVPLGDDCSGASYGNEATSGMTPLLYARMGESLCPEDFNVWRPLSYANVNLPWNSALTPPREDILLHTYAQIAHGGASFLGIHALTDNYTNLLSEIVHESNRREPWRGGKSQRHLAIHLSQASRDFWAKDNPSEYIESWLGAYEMAAECGVPLGIVFDSQLNEDCLADYHSLFLPESVCLSQSQAEAIEGFVRAGGTLVVTGQTGILDEQGQSRTSGVLDDFLGIQRKQDSKMQWMIVGPFDNPESKGFDMAFGPEKGPVDLTAEYEGAGGKTVRWKEYPVFGNYINFLDQFSLKEWVCAYAYTKIYSDEEKDIKFLVGSDDGIKIWLNGNLIHEVFRLRGVFEQQDVVAVRLRKGENHILVKVEQRFWDWGFILEIIQPDEPIKPFKVPFAPICLINEKVRSSVAPWVWIGPRSTSFELQPELGVEIFASELAKDIGEGDISFLDPISSISEKPAITLRHLGKGEAFYVNANLGKAQMCCPEMNFGDLFKAIVTKQGTPVKINGPSSVELSAFWKNGHFICHLLNRPFTSARPIMQENCRSVLKSPPLCAKVDLIVEYDDFPSRVFLPLENRELDVKQGSIKNTCVLEIEVLRHQLVVFEGLKLKYTKT